MSTQSPLPNDDLTPTAVIPHLTTQWLGRSYHYVEAIDSTNEELKRWAAERPLPSGTVLVANHQTAGKGRLNRRWEAPAGTALLFSTLFQLDWPAEKVHWLTMIGATAGVSAITAITQLPIKIKWPNDLVLWHEGAWRKLGGLLVEGEFDENGRLRTAILGIGLNINLTADQLPSAIMPPTSLRLAVGRPVSRRAVLSALLAELESLHEAALAGQSPQPRWNELLITTQQPVQVTHSGGSEPISGIAETTDEWGRLLVRDANGTLHPISAGDVTLRHDASST